MFTSEKREGISTFVCAVSLYVAETPKASIKDHEPPLPVIPFGIVAYGFFGQPFSKQLNGGPLRSYNGSSCGGSRGCANEAPVHRSNYRDTHLLNSYCVLPRHGVPWNAQTY